MTDTWAAKVLEGVPRCDPFWNRLVMIAAKDGDYVEYADALAAIAKLAEGDGLVERATAALEGVTDGPWTEHDKGKHPNPYVCGATESYEHGDDQPVVAYVVGMSNAANRRFIAFTRQWVPEAAAHIAALTAQNRELALDVLASSGQAQEAYAAQLAAEAERDYTHGTNEVLRSENQRLEAERDALRAKVARLEGALTDMPKAVLRATVCQGPVWPGDGLVNAVYLRDIDGTGSLHVCSKGDPGAIAHVPAAHIAALTAQLAEKEEQLVSVLRREAATHERHDAKMEAADE